MSDAKELSSALGMKKAMQILDELMKEKGVSEDTRSVAINSIEMMYEYIPYASQQRKRPDDPKVLAEFLATKGAKMAKYMGNDSVNCGAAIVEFLLSVRRGVASSGTVPVSVLAWGLAFLDLIEVGNSCEFAQRGYYEAFLRESDVKLKPIRRQVQMSSMH